MRIIGGFLKKKSLKSVPGMATRPTSDRLRETLFNILAFDIRGANVLDLFAGTGALGLEALSRGANHCTFIDNQKRSIDVIRTNINACSLNHQTTVFTWDAARNLNCLKTLPQPLDIVFMDPPYHRDLISPTLTNLLRTGKLNAGARIIIEHGSDESVLLPMDTIIPDDVRTYGKTSVTFCTNTSG